MAHDWARNGSVQRRRPERITDSAPCEPLTYTPRIGASAQRTVHRCHRSPGHRRAPAKRHRASNLGEDLISMRVGTLALTA
jgi:hypothetical protein